MAARHVGVWPHWPTIVAVPGISSSTCATFPWGCPGEMNHRWRVLLVLSGCVSLPTPGGTPVPTERSSHLQLLVCRPTARPNT
eukprot:scaffold291_cov332-Pavlova_lutheri.AAC.5